MSMTEYIIWHILGYMAMPMIFFGWFCRHGGGRLFSD